MTGAQGDGLWVSSDVLPSGGYGITVSVGGDHAWPLTPEQAVRYAALCARRATEAEHHTATLTWLTAPYPAGGRALAPDAAAAFVAQDLATDQNDEDTAPLAFFVAIAQVGTGKLVPLLRVTLSGEPVGEVTPADLRGHAMGVLQAMAAVDLDTDLARALGALGVEPDRARTMVGTLHEFWPAPEQPRTGPEGQ